MELKVTKKRLDTSPIQKRLVQGEALVDRPKIILQKEYEGLDISDLNFEIRAVSEKETMVRRSLGKSLEDGLVILSWTVTKEFTAVAGALSLTIVGTNAAGDEIMKITSEKIEVRPDPDGDWTAPPMDLLEDALNQMAALQEAAQQAKEGAEAARDDAKGHANDAAESARQAAASAGAAADSAADAKTSADNASASADKADASAEDAADSRDKAARYAELALQGANDKGRFTTPEALNEAYPTGQDGWWALVDTTGTIWVWDSDTGQWVNSGKSPDGGIAAFVSYDGTGSGLPADNVQVAVDEVHADYLRLLRDLMQGKVSAGMLTRDGRIITTKDGTAILAVRKL